MIFSHTMDFSNGEIILNNGKIVEMYQRGGSILFPEEIPAGSGLENSTDNIWASVQGYGILNYDDRNLWPESAKIYRDIVLDSGEEMFTLDNQLISKEEWQSGIQTDIIDNLIPQDQFYEANLENLQKVLLN